MLLKNKSQRFSRSVAGYIRDVDFFKLYIVVYFIRLWVNFLIPFA